MTIVPGDVVIGRPAGGGGFGDPLRRDPEAVARDVRNDYVSREVAESVYGVVLTESGDVDADATARRRSEAAGGSS